MAPRSFWCQKTLALAADMSRSQHKRSSVSPLHHPICQSVLSVFSVLVSTMAYNYAAIDVQMYRGIGSVPVIKEFSVYNPNMDLGHTVMFEPPYDSKQLTDDTRRHNNYVLTHIHNIRWDAGDIPYCKLEETLRGLTLGYPVLYVKGNEKMRFLRVLIPHAQVIDIETLGCPPLHRLPKLFVDYHGRQHSVAPFHRCAATNAKRIGLWYRFTTLT